MTSAHAASTTELERDDEFWLKDGSVVLVAGNVGFKVYKDLLATHSPIFHDMFAQSRPDEQEMYDGCPVVHLSDAPCNLRHFLRALIHTVRPLFYRSDEDTKISIDELFAVAHLAHKYDVGELLRQALVCLKSYYTNRLDIWKQGGQAGNVPFETSDKDPLYAIGVVNLAHLTQTPSMLPLALYDCCYLGGRVVRGWARDDGTVEHLSLEDLERCMDGSTALATRAVCSSMDLHAAVEQADLCVHSKPVRFGGGGACEAAQAKVKSRLKTNKSFLGTRALHSHMATASLSPHFAKMCSTCLSTLQGRERATHEAVWAQLPSLFNLSIPDWQAKTSN
ncbi:hypothetical protein OH76DRAFT_1485594 [Lentinus brumalis]|uniref:BTB domain-containing protein n=1 Tax=Lentinus brumalis TaxID=2498619 RepID=A0A371D1E2_9APHY|nr:hypothetical protein OH76DRAFT_1485594 [Polyporus brumalis]